MCIGKIIEHMVAANRASDSGALQPGGVGWPRSSRIMKKRTTQKEPPRKQDDDLWAWAVIGLIFGSVTLAL
jgi:hypothetical protein